jgi:hypothetical protein
MKDAFGTKIRVGDTVVYGRSSGNHGVTLEKRLVIAVEADKIQVTWEHEIWSWDRKTQTGGYKQKLAKSWIGESSRLVVVK